ncbi:MAG: hypothetical protein FJX15_13630 [Alphaproteobacteria bacterium]|nr:hypothetical protein [Alphaproteobacteria bacterium]MBM3642334.1 hypothetical protein [Alphaproteobacteria bacterium]
MMTISLKPHGKARALFSSVVAGLFLMQVLGLVVASSGCAAFLSDDAGVSIAMAGEYCGGKTHDGDRQPVQPSHHHCALCSIGYYDDAVDAVANLAEVIIVLTPQSDAAAAPFIHDELAPPLLGWTSSWSSRAPPFS